VYLDPITKARETLVLNLENKLYRDADTFKLSVAAMGGITGFRSLRHGPVTIHDRIKNTEGNWVYEVTLDNAEDGIVKLLSEEELSTDKKGVEDRLINMYTDVLMDDLGNGQTRYFVPKLLEDASDADMKKISAILRAAWKQKNREEGQRVPGLNSVRKKIRDDVLGYDVTWEYTYITIKQGEGTAALIDPDTKKVGGETYNTYLVNKKEVKALNKFGPTINFFGKTKELAEEGDEIVSVQRGYKQNELDKVMKEGFWKSEENENFGKHTYTSTETITLKDGTQVDMDEENLVYLEKDIKGSQKKNWVNFKRLEKQPDEGAMEHVWVAMGIIRDSYASAFRDLQEQNRRTESKRALLHQNIINWRVKDLKESHEDAAIWLSDKLKSLGISEYIRISEAGKIITSTTFSKKKPENYYPNMYHRENIFTLQIPASIAELRVKRQEVLKKLNLNVKEGGKKLGREDLKDVGQYENSDLERLDIGLAHMEKLLADYNSGTDVDMGSINDLNVLKVLKHITSWTNPMMRRKDGGVHSDYFSQSYNTIHKNDITIELMNAIYKMTRLDKNIPEGSLEYMVNRVKIGFGDPTSRSQTFFGESSYEKMGEKLNGLPDWVLGGVVHNGKSAERLTKWLTAPASMMFLGGKSALGNSAQIVNQVMRVGWKLARKAYRAYEGDKDAWKDIIRNTGILNVMTMFTDIMLKDGKSKFGDMGLVNLGGVPVPTMRMVEFGRLLKMGRENFVTHGTDQLDAFLFKLLKNAQGETREEINRLMDLNELRKQVGDKKLRAMRGKLFAIFTLEKDQSKETIEKAFRELLTKVSDTQLKKMVSWKLSWWFDAWGGPGKDVFTFTGSEQRLRILTAMMGLFHAQQTGLLPEGEDWVRTMKTDNAVRIARNAVYYTQFGMTPPYLGEGFNGFGRALWQYKQYPTLQMIHDGQIFLQFSDGNYGAGDGLWRMTKAIAQSTKNWKGKNKKSYDPSDPDLDHEAIMMARWIGTRGIASILASTIGAIPYISTGLRAISPGLPIYSLFRGAENPAFGLLTRSIVWTSMFMMGADDEDEKNDIFGTLGFFFAPVLIGMMVRGIWNAYEFTDDLLD